MSKINLDQLLQDMLDALDVVIRRGEPHECDRGERLEAQVLETFDQVTADLAEARLTGHMIGMPASLMAFESLRLDVLEIGQKVYQRFQD